MLDESSDRVNKMDDRSCLGVEIQSYLYRHRAKPRETDVSKNFSLTVRSTEARTDGRINERTDERKKDPPDGWRNSG